nr:MFS transporter [Vibrio sinus]
MRGPVTGAATLIDDIISSLSLSASQAGFLTSLPLLAFAFFSPIAVYFSSRIGIVSTLFLGICTITLGIIVRSLGGIDLLFLGTLLIGIGIALSNVMLPSIVKKYFPEKVSELTSLYVLFISIGGAVCSSVYIPISQDVSILGLSGWKLALLSTLILAIIPLILWSIRLNDDKDISKNKSESVGLVTMAQSWVAWEVTLFLAFTSLVNYTFITWLPSILVDMGYSPEYSGFLHGGLQLAGVLPSLILLPILSGKFDKRYICIMSTLLVLASIVGFLLLPSLSLVWVIAMGVGNSGAFIMALSFIGLRTNTPQETVALSSLAQFVGYLFAAIGPVIFGGFLEQGGGWKNILQLMIVACLIWTFLGAIAGKKSKVSLYKLSGNERES